MEETIINNNNMEEKLILNSIEDAEIISVRLSPDKTPIAYENKDTEVESRAMLLIDLLDKKVLTLSDLNLN